MAKQIPVGPFDDMRSYLDALEATGNLVCVDELDQGRFEMTALMYKLVDRYGIMRAPGLRVERLKLADGSVVGPVVGNIYGGAISESLAIGLPTANDPSRMYKQAFDHWTKLAGWGGYPKIPPHEVKSADAPVKQVVLTGDDVDLFALPFIQTNPADAGRYITTPNVVLSDEKLGTNVGTYRCQIRTKNQISVNAGLGQDGRAILVAKQARGEKFAHCAIAVGTDPLMYAASCSKLGAPGANEMEIAGGLRGRPVDVVKAEHSDLLVPANAEFIIEGRISLEETKPEGPFGELYGFLGEQWPENWFMDVTAITHRKDPIVPNAFTGIERGFVQAASTVAQTNRYKGVIPGLKAIHLPSQTMSCHVVQINKTKPGQGMSAGLTYSGSFSLAKLVIVVDEDVDIFNYDKVMNALSGRWQPGRATTIIPAATGVNADPSVGPKLVSSRMVIDATQPMPQEGGSDHFPAMSRTLLSNAVPDVFDYIDENWERITGERQ